MVFLVLIVDPDRYGRLLGFRLGVDGCTPQRPSWSFGGRLDAQFWLWQDLMSMHSSFQGNWWEGWPLPAALVDLVLFPRAVAAIVSKSYNKQRQERAVVMAVSGGEEGTSWWSWEGEVVWKREIAPFGGRKRLGLGVNGPLAPRFPLLGALSDATAPWWGCDGALQPRLN